ncbi:MAG: hypothetical protein C4321_07500, partial [Chloroflexota bacterium]
MAWALVVCAVGIFVWVNRADLPVALHAIRDAHLGWLAAAAGCTGIYLVGQAGMYAETFRAVKLDGSVATMLRPSLAAGALNIVSKSAGMGGLPVFLAEGRRRGQPGGLVTTAYTGVVVVSHATFALTLALVFAMMWFDGHLTRLELAAGGVFGVYAVAQAVLLLSAVRSREACRRVFRLTGMATHAARAPFSPVDAAADELFDTLASLRRSPAQLMGVLAWGMVVEFAGAALLWCVARALGEPLSPAGALAGYAMTVLFSTVGALPGGLGFAEVSLGAVLSGYGLSVASIAAMV